MKEIWKPLYGYKNWEISSQGRIRKTFTPKPYVNQTGYSVVHVSQDSIQRKIALHRAVYETFVDEIPENMMINHINGIKTDNRIENLELVTNRENIEHYKNNLLTYKGEIHHKAKLTQADVDLIRKRKKFGVSTMQLSKEYGVNPSTIKRIIARKTWKDQLTAGGDSLETRGAFLWTQRMALSPRPVLASCVHRCAPLLDTG